MKQIQDEPKTMRCLNPACRHGRIWKAGQVCSLDEIVRRINLRHDDPAQYLEETDECPGCKGQGKIPAPELKG